MGRRQQNPLRIWPEPPDSPPLTRNIPPFPISVSILPADPPDRTGIFLSHNGDVRLKESLKTALKNFARQTIRLIMLKRGGGVKVPDQQPRSDSGPRPSIDPEPFALSDGRSSPFDWLVRTGLPLLLLVFMVSLSLLLCAGNGRATLTN